MKSVEFCYWLQGYFEVRRPEDTMLTTEQVNTIQKHLALVFKHEIDPSYPKEEQGPLNELHGGTMRC